MANIKNLPTVTQLVITTTQNKGVGFASIFYTNKEGETARYLVNVNATLTNAKAKDLKVLEAITDKELTAIVDDSKGLTIEVLTEAKDALIQSIVKPNENRSNGQINAYTKINEAMKYHNETGEISIFGLLVSKQIIKPIEGERKTVNSKPLTIAKRKIEKHFELKAPQFRAFNIGQMFSAKLNGETLEFSDEN